MIINIWWVDILGILLSSKGYTKISQGGMNANRQQVEYEMSLISTSSASIHLSSSLLQNEETNDHM